MISVLKRAIYGAVTTTAVFIFLHTFSLSAQTLPLAEIRTHKGTPTLHINGVPNAALCYWGGRPIPELFEQF